jgi:hypothetical protein
MVDVVAGMTVLTLGGTEAVVVGTRLRVTEGAGATVADVVGAEVVWLVVRGDGGAVVISGEGVVAALDGGGGDGCEDRVGAVGDTAVNVTAGAVDVSAGMVALATSGVIGAGPCCSPPKLSTTTPISRPSSAPPTPRPV